MQVLTGATMKQQLLEIIPNKHMSEEGFLLNTAGVFAAQKCQQHIRMVHHTNPSMLTTPCDGAEPPKQQRSFALCEYAVGNQIAYYWADYATGTLYRTSDGACATSKELQLGL